MRIVHVVRQFAPGVGGLENYVRCLVREQRRQGHEPSVVTLNRLFDAPDVLLPDREVIDGVDVHRVAYRGSKRYPLAPGVLRHVREADLIHVHAVDFFADFLAHAGFIHRKPMVLSTHGGFFHTPYAQGLKKWYFKHITGHALKGYGAVIACSHADAALFEPICGDRLVTVENGVEVDRFSNIAAPDAKTIISFGRLAPNKRPDLLLQWFARVAEIDREWRLIIAGRPMGVEPDDLTQLARRLGIESRVEVHALPDDAHLRALIASASIFASSSAFEGFGLAAVEAAAAGLYPILSDIPAHRRTRDRLRFGDLIDFEDPASAAEFCRRHAAGALRPPSADARGGALATFTWPYTAECIDSVYKELLGQERRWIGGIAVQALDEPRAIAQLESIVDRHEPKVVSFCNAHTVTTARDDGSLVAAMSKALVLNDGVGLDIASRILYGSRFPANLNGTDLLPSFLAHADRRLRVYLVGSAPGIAARAGRVLMRRYPHIDVVGSAHGFFGLEDEPELRNRIRHAAPDVVLVGMGQPYQENWAARNVEALRMPVICVGGFIDFTAEATQRAPEWVRAARLEWVHRALSDPRRLLRRYTIGNARFLIGLVREAAAGVHHVDPRNWRMPERSPETVTSRA
ncbi:WecB/TagA/CpsF family glycosyltransferase [Sphingomonas sp. IC4-52]|uniref:WecB/TagA/CpsF family glycosyltransferase n=1 Tax=Sphingomonas sp. IC4-52 TaxID=2887202 RepID=UPI001D11B0FF|nr:WecB/TagA/CpsF family glycosyltransferase [Sphingomonas sp. IC4-52]MCC2979784.1 WecB/TagA/CpsF family glycosyltransferase [Sphingomonas sp. IC4-52]